MDLATTEEKKRLAKLSGTSMIYLYSIAAGERKASAELAGRIEEASHKMRLEAHLPELLRSDICPTCRKCPYSLKCGE